MTYLVPLNPHRDPVQQLIDSEPPTAAIIACKVNVGTGVEPRWESRTYEARRLALAGIPSRSFRVHFGECAGPGELFADWSRVVAFLESMRAQHIELIIE